MEKPQSLLAPSFIIGSCLLACPRKNGAVAQPRLIGGTGQSSPDTVGVGRGFKLSKP
jgi:hypothetical protein